MPDDDRELYEMHGTVADWDGWRGDILTECGERLYLSRLTLSLLGCEQEPKVGDRIRLLASRRVTVTYHIEAVESIIAEVPDREAIARLRSLHRSRTRQRDSNEFASERLTGTVESYDSSKGYGFIRADTGQQVLLHVTCLRASGYRMAVPGSSVSFDALERPNGWQAFRIHSLEPPQIH